MLKGFLSRFTSFICKAIAITIIVLALLLNIVHLTINFLPKKGDFIAAVASVWLGKSVSVKNADLKGALLSPVIVLNNVSLGQKNHRALYFDRLTLSLDVYKSLTHWAWITRQVTISDMRLSVIQTKDNHLVLKGLSVAGSGGLSNDRDFLLRWLKLQPSIGFKDLRVDWLDESSQSKSTLITDVLLENKPRAHQFALSLRLSHHEKAHLILKGQLVGKAKNVLNNQWQIYLHAKQMPLGHWLHLLPMLQKKTMSMSGRVNLAAWATIKNGQLISSYSEFSLYEPLFQLKSGRPGVLLSHINGAVSTNGLQGRLLIHAPDFQLFPELWFLHGFNHVAFSLSMSWQKSVHKKIALSIQHLYLHHGPLKFNLHGKLTVFENHTPFLDLMGEIKMKNIHRLSRYLPHHLLSKKLNHWLQYAFRSGEISEARWLLRGNLADFPFAKHKGHFEVFANVKHTNLHFTKDWPDIKHLNARLDFDNQGLLITANHAMIDKVKLDAVRVSIADLSKPILSAVTKAYTKVPAALSFLQRSPLIVGRDITKLHGQGEVKAKLILRLPLFGVRRQPDSTGEIEFFKDQLGVSGVPFLLDALHGVLKFHNGRVLQSQLNAMLLGKPLSLKLFSTNMHQPGQALNIVAQGGVMMSHVRSFIPVKFASLVRGVFPFRATFVLHDLKSQVPNTLTLRSDLSGLDMGQIPAPFNKKIKAHFPVSLKLIQHAKNSLQVWVHWSSILKASLAFRHLSHCWTLYSGLIHWGAGEFAHQSAGAGVYVNGYLGYLNIDAWQRFLAQHIFSHKNHVSDSLFAPEWLKQVDLTIGVIDMGLNHWSDTYLRYHPVKMGDLLACQNAFVSGQVLLPKSSDMPWQARFDYLFYKKEKRANTFSLDPVAMPSLDLTIKDLRINNQMDGKIQLVVHHRADGLVIKQLLVDAPYFSLNAKGLWYKQDNQEYTHLNGQFNSANLGLFLTTRQLSSRIEGGVLNSGFDLTWPKAPSKFSLKRLKGEVDLNVSNGHILRLDAQTESNLDLGRLLNVLSPESLSKLISLDFSDLTEEGFLFHHLTGQFDLNAGVIKTEDTKIDSTVAQIGIQGKMGLVDHVNDLYMTVTPQVSSSLPFIIGVAGGPVAGIASWIANKVIGPGVGRMMRVTYHIGGYWDKPLVKKLP